MTWGQAMILGVVAVLATVVAVGLGAGVVAEVRVIARSIRKWWRAR